MDAPGTWTARTRPRPSPALDTHHEALATSAGAGQEHLAELSARATAQDLALVMERAPDAVAQLRALDGHARSALTAERIVTTHNQVERNHVGGDLNVAGGNLSVRRDV